MNKQERIEALAWEIRRSCFDNNWKEKEVEATIAVEFMDAQYAELVADRTELFPKIKTILAGIDSCDCDDDEAFWDTSTGAEWGSRMLKELELLILGAKP